MRGHAAVADPSDGIPLTGCPDLLNCVSMSDLLPCQRHLFDLPADIAYLNCAYMSPLLKRAAEVGAEAIARKCQP
jgi:hypothetical protein